MEVRVDSGHDKLLSNESSSGCEPVTSQNVAPPKITPYSGVLGKGKEVIRPIAFKPVRMLDNCGERYSSVGDLRHHGSNSICLANRRLFSSPPLSSLPMISSCKLVGCESLESVRTSPMSHNMSGDKSSCGSLLDLTPSPSDAKDRDSELASLRQTMEHNEQVIFRVYQEKERVWERELRRIKSVHENRLRAGAQKALKLEQMLMMQTYQLQQEKKRLKEEADRVAQESGELRQEVELLRGRLEETEWGLCQKTGELSLLKAQLKDAQTSKGQELVQLKSQVRDLKTELEKSEKGNAILKQQVAEMNEELGSLRREEEDWLRQEVDRLGVELSRERTHFEQERVTWAQEKEKVLRYQRQLQLNYVQMFRRTRTLEAEVESLTLELELETKGTAIKKSLPAIEMGHTIQL